MTHALTLIRGVAALGVAFWIAAPAMAAEENGVTCPAGTTAEQGNDRRLLKCSKPQRLERESHCLHAGFSGLQQVIRTGPDMCTDALNKANAGAPVALLLPGDSPSGWVREDTPGGRDVFVKIATVHVFPEGALFNPIDNPALGVSCPSGFADGDSVSGGRGIRCEKVARIAADCDFGWTLRVDDNGGQTDKCIGINGVGPTKPAGLPNAVYQTQKGKWILDVNAGPDKFREFAFPVSRR